MTFDIKSISELKFLNRSFFLNSNKHDFTIQILRKLFSKIKILLHVQ